MGLGEDFLQHGRVLDVVAGRLGLGGAEAQHGVTLPKAYQALMLTENGKKLYGALREAA